MLTHTTALIWRGEDNVLELVLSSTMCVLRIELMSSGLVTASRPTEPFLQPTQWSLDIWGLFKILFSVHGCFACMYTVHHMQTWCPGRPEEGGRVPGTGVLEGYESPCEIKAWSSGRAARVLDHWANSPALALWVVGFVAGKAVGCFMRFFFKRIIMGALIRKRINTEGRREENSKNVWKAIRNRIVNSLPKYL